MVSPTIGCRPRCGVFAIDGYGACTEFGTEVERQWDRGLQCVVQHAGFFTQETVMISLRPEIGRVPPTCGSDPV